MSGHSLATSGWPLAAALAALACAPIPAVATNPDPQRTGTTPFAQPPLIPRAVLFGNPDRAQLRISPDGKQMAFLAPVDGVLNLWVAPAGRLAEARAITADKGRGIMNFSWAFNSSHLLFTQDKGGDENWKIYSVDTTTPGAEPKDLTPFDTIPGPDGKPLQQMGRTLRPQARLEGVSEKFPTTIIVGLNNRNPQLHDLHKVDIISGTISLYYQNDSFAGLDVDDDFRLLLAMRQNPAGGMDVFRNTGPALPDADKPVAAKFEPWQSIPMEDALTTGPLGFNRDGTAVYMRDSRGRNTGAMFSVDLATGKATLVAESPKADAGGAMIHPTTRAIQAVSFNHLRNQWTVVDDAIKPDLAFLRTVADGDISVTSRTLDDSKWTVSFLLDNGPVKTFLYDRTAKKADLIFTNKKDLEGLPLAKMSPVVIKSRDGLELVSYLTLPVDSWSGEGSPRPKEPLALVLDVHGGPWARDSWGLNPNHQWLANRGYAVLSVNFRGSTGFGKSFVNAGNLEWATKMHDDLIDAVNWAVAERIADPKRVAIMGGSYGGYAALVGATFTPDVFACAVSVVGPSNLVTLLNSIPPYWAPIVEQFTKRVGDHRTEDGRKLLESRSPLNKVDQIKRPLLIGQGANDPRVKQEESDQIVKKMSEKKIPVTYVLFPDEGHGFARPPNRMAFNAVLEAFLAEHLGGRAEPVGNDFKGSSITVPTGADDIKGLKPALDAIKK